MARISRTNPSYNNANQHGDTGRERHYMPNEGPVYDAPNDSSEYSDSVAYKVKASDAYKNAYALFVQDNDKSWLQRLVAIPTSVEDATESWTDQIGITTNYADKQAANYQYCMQQIQQLVSDYYEFKNSLPVTQVQQQADAGINAAITGNRINGSQMPLGNAPTANPSSLQSAQPFEIIKDAASFILDTSSGLANLALQYKQLRLSTRTQQFSEDSALLDFKKYASEQGMSLNGNATWQDVIKEYGWKVDDPAGMSRYSDNILRKYLTHHANSSVISGLAAIYPSISAMMEVAGDDRPYVYTGIEQSPIYLDETNKAMISLLSAQREYDAKIKKLTMMSAEHNAGKAFTEKTTAEFNQIVSQYESTRAEIASSLIKSLMASENESDKLLLSRILWNATYNTVELEKKQNDWFTADKVSGVIGNIF